MYNFFWVWLIFLSFTCCNLVALKYDVLFEGKIDKQIQSQLKAKSQLISLKKHEPDSFNALKFRLESDILDLIKYLQSLGYYDSDIQGVIEPKSKNALVRLKVEKGERYKLHDYTVYFYSGYFENKIDIPEFDLSTNGIYLNSYVNAKNILEGELNILSFLADKGYPLAKIDKRECLADKNKKTIHIDLEINTGPLCKFGQAQISSNPKVKTSFIESKLAWKEQELYSGKKVDTTQKKLMDTGLFSSVLITHDDTPNGKDELKMFVETTDTLQRNISLGLSYQTFFGPGVTLSWELRNIAGLGRKFSLEGDITKNNQIGTAIFIWPDFGKVDQNLVIHSEAGHEKIAAYMQRFYSFCPRIEKTLGGFYRYSLAIGVSHLTVDNSAADGVFSLLEIPFYLRWSNVKDLLNPSRGITWEYQFCPSSQINKLINPYIVNKISCYQYIPLNKNQNFVFAHKGILGVILNKNIENIPLPKRFLGGSDDDLRGYKYHTVSPLNKSNRPLGGRSFISYTAELRSQFYRDHGVVGFLDVGKVDSTVFPSWKNDYLMSVGVGYRYFSFFGPIRMDLAFPLKARAHLDPKYRLLISIGQSF